MALYEYQCDACGKRFERIQKFSDPPPEACPSCGGAVRKLMSSPAFQFKGSGWYATDYAKPGKSETAERGEKKGDDKAKPGAGESSGEKADKPKGSAPPAPSGTKTGE